MVEEDGLVLPAQALAEAKTLLRAGDAGEDAVIAAALDSAARLCERFTGQALIARGFRQVLDVADARRRNGWRRLARTPVRSIGAVETLAADGTATPLTPAEYAIDIDANGDGWIRTAQACGGRIRVAFEAGLGADWESVPAPLRHGILRLAAHLYVFRTDTGAQAEPPAAVTALWRPWRRLHLG
jgi:uncharacterized phiE125 gp8 family phage protein